MSPESPAHPLHKEGVRAAESFADCCQPLQNEKHLGGRGAGGPWPGSKLANGRERNFC